MEELTAIKTADGREFKPWASKEIVQEVVLEAVQDPASITAISSEIAAGKAAIASAIVAKGGSASATDSFAQLAEAVEEIPNYSDMVKLAGIIAGGNYDKDALQGHNENVKYGKTEIVDNVGAFENINVDYCFQNWDLLTLVKLPSLINFSGVRIFSHTGNGVNTEVHLDGMVTFPTYSQLFYYSRIKKLYIPNCTNINTGYYDFYLASELIELEVGTLHSLSWGFIPPVGNVTRNIIVGVDIDIDLLFQQWTATSVIAEGQSGIDELNSNLFNNLLTKLYDHSQDGQTRTLRLGWLANVSAENIAYANAKGWTLTN